MVGAKKSEFVTMVKSQGGHLWRKVGTLSFALRTEVFNGEVSTVLN